VIHRVFLFIIVSVVTCTAFFGCGKSEPRSLSNGKVLLQASLDEKKRLITRLGFTNVLSHGPMERDSLGTHLFLRVETGTSFDTAQQLRTQQLVVITAEGVRIKPWHFPANEKVTDDEELAVWQHPQPDCAWQVRSGELLPKDCSLPDVSGDWIAVYAKVRPPWIAKLDTPNVVAAELPDSPGLIAIFADGPRVHVFARRGWRNEEGVMKYSVYDFRRGGSKPIKETTFPWARISIDMDPDSNWAVLNDNNRFWGRTWLVNLRTGKRESISVSDWTLIVRKEVAQKWIELTKP
jgi:hypothetical protein